jgi:hypothetical protein
VTLVESPDHSPIGVGEATTSLFGDFMRALNVPEPVWMNRCQATFKLGVRFEGWSGRREPDTYFHPFWSPKEEALREDLEAWRRQRGTESPDLVQDHRLATHVAATHRSAHPWPTDLSDPEMPQEMMIAYHLDTAKLATFLRGYATSHGIRHVRSNVQHVRTEDGQIVGLQTDSHGELEADFFMDCSGFGRLLAHRSLGSEFTSLSDRILCDRACAIRLPRENTDVPTYSTATAMNAGWRWHIPLRDEDTFGYIYSSRDLERVGAEAELKESLGSRAQGSEVLHLSFESGYLKEPWKGNCLALGLAAGFVEPLEALALALTQVSLAQFLQGWSGFNPDPAARETYNSSRCAMYESAANFIACHYSTTGRTDTEFWRSYRRVKLDENLQSGLAAWEEKGTSLGICTKALPRLSWMSVLEGMGCAYRGPAVNSDRRLDQKLLEIRADHALTASRICSTHPTHHQYLRAVAELVDGRSHA